MNIESIVIFAVAVMVVLTWLFVLGAVAVWLARMQTKPRTRKRSGAEDERLLKPKPIATVQLVNLVLFIYRRDGKYGLTFWKTPKARTYHGEELLWLPAALVEYCDKIRGLGLADPEDQRTLPVIREAFVAADRVIRNRDMGPARQPANGAALADVSLEL